MAVPKRKTSPSRRNMRRSHDALKPVNVVENKTTGGLQLSHTISEDGFYKGRQVIKMRVRRNASDDMQEEDNN